MRRSTFIYYFIVSIILCVNESFSQASNTYKTIDYLNGGSFEKSSEDFPNPDRGFYRMREVHTSQYQILNEQELVELRSGCTSNCGRPRDYLNNIKSSLILRHIILDNFELRNLSVPNEIPRQTIENLRQDFEIAKNAGVKLILRFSYTTNSPNCCERLNCDQQACDCDCTEPDSCCPCPNPSYGDLPKDRVLKHIKAFSEVIEQNADLVAVVQMGFIGVWGEGFYTDHFDQTPEIEDDEWYKNDWQNRIDVLTTLLDNLPDDMMVQVRYPIFKQKAFYGLESTSDPILSQPLNAAQAYSKKFISRVGYFNDCVTGDITDLGTFTNYGVQDVKGNISQKRVYNDSFNLRTYMSLDSRYVPVGGETCLIGSNSRSNCVNDNGSPGILQTELKNFHWSFLHSDFNLDVIDNWDGTCLEEVSRNLGYRLVLTEGHYPDKVLAGRELKINIKLINEGFAAPFNPKLVQLILISDRSNDNMFNTTEYKFDLEADPRYWLPGDQIEISESVCLPKNLLSGKYNMYLSISDPSFRLRERPEYKIRIANKSVKTKFNIDNFWIPSKGYNNLGHTINIYHDEWSFDPDIGLPPCDCPAKISNDLCGDRIIGISYSHNGTHQLKPSQFPLEEIVRSNSVYDDDLRTAFVSSHDDWQYVNIDFGCSVNIIGFRRLLSWSDSYTPPIGPPVRSWNSTLSRVDQGENFSYSIDGANWIKVSHNQTSGWNNTYTPYTSNSDAWHTVNYGWSRWIYFDDNIKGKQFRFNWDGIIGEGLREIEILYESN